MDFDFSDEQTMLFDSIDRFGHERWPASSRIEMARDYAKHVEESWESMAELGWLAVAIPESAGGMGGTDTDIMALMTGMGRHLIPVPYVTSCVLAPALLRHGDDSLLAIMQAVGEGRARVAAGFYEPGAGYSLSRVGVRVQQVAEGWRLTGMKSHVEDGGDADWFIVSARTSGGDCDVNGISLFVLPSDAPGLSVERYQSIDGHRHARLRLDGAHTTRRIGETDSALPLIEAAVERAICAQLAETVGSMEMANAITLDYLKTRVQFGQTIGSFQAIQHRAVDMAIAAEEARSMLYHAVLSLDDAPSVRRRAVSAAKVRAGQCGVYIGQNAVQLHGGVGTCEELIISHHLRRQMMLDSAWGSADFHKERYQSAA